MGGTSIVYGWYHSRSATNYQFKCLTDGGQSPTIQGLQRLQSCKACTIKHLIGQHAFNMPTALKPDEHRQPSTIGVKSRRHMRKSWHFSIMRSRTSTVMQDLWPILLSRSNLLSLHWSNSATTPTRLPKSMQSEPPIHLTAADHLHVLTAKWRDIECTTVSCRW